MDTTRTNTRARNRGRRKSFLRKLVFTSQVAVLLCMGVGIGIVGGTFISMSKLLPNMSSIKPIEATKIISSDGVLLGTVYEENREYVALDKIPKVLKDATIAVEDKRFYAHSGVDIRGIGRAVFENLRGRRLSQGGSTITQQLARNIYLTQKRTFSRKMQEAALAVLLERYYSKKKILELYLNQVYYGSGAYGVETASKVYYGKGVADISLGEAALLSGLPKAPSAYTPHENLEAAVNRRDVVLDLMAEEGYITAQERDEAKAEKTKITPRKPSKQRYKAPYFVDYVVRQLSREYGEDLIYRGGLRVYTTLNWEMQQKAEEAVKKGVRSALRSQNVHQAGLISIEADTGYIRAMVGGVEYKQSQFNRMTQGLRQPGSAFKAFVYTAAMDNGMTPDKRILDAPKSFPAGAGQKPWSPKNYDRKYPWRGMVTIRKAVAYSINMPAIKVAEEIGVREVIKYAKLMGITADLEPYLPLAIGGIKGVHPIEMASAYGVFATKGLLAERIAILRITDDEGSIVEENEPVVKRVLNAKTAETMDSLFREVVITGTGRKVGDVPTARGKTGTTNEDRDAWFIGYTTTPQLVTAVWAGNDDYAPMKNVYGGTVCGPIWREYTLTAQKVYKKNRKPKPKVVPVKLNETREDPFRDENRNRTETIQDVEQNNDSDTVTATICIDSQLLATRQCPNTMTETYPKGSEPGGYCDIHGSSDQTDQNAGENADTDTESPEVETISLAVCTETGDVASRYCPSTETKRFASDGVPTQLCRKHKGS